MGASKHIAQSHDSPEILSGPAAERTVRCFLRRCGRARLAVAYWGAGAARRLGLAEAVANGSDIEIICDVLSGGCNPDEVAELIGLLGSKKVRSKDGLHAKVWITDKGCLLGSSNSSANGLGHEGDETRGLIEANLAYGSPSEGALAAWDNWYEQNASRGSQPVSDAMLEIARERWLSRRSIRDGAPNTGRANGSLLAMLVSDPGYFQDKPFEVAIYSQAELSAVAEDGLASAQAALGITDGSLLCYEQWRLAPGTYVLDMNWDAKARNATSPGLWRILTDRPYRRLKGTSITLCMKARAFEGLTIKGEGPKVTRLASQVMRASGENELFVSGEKFGRLLAAVS